MFLLLSCRSDAQFKVFEDHLQALCFYLAVIFELIQFFQCPKVNFIVPSSLIQEVLKSNFNFQILTIFLSNY